MGYELRGTVTVDGQQDEGRMLLETEEIIFRGNQIRFRVRHQDVKSVTVQGETLILDTNDGRHAEFGIGTAAQTWLKKIVAPPSRSKKLGIKKGMRIAVERFKDPLLAKEIAAAGAEITTLRKSAPLDLIFLGADSVVDLQRLISLKESLRPEGAVWVVRPRGIPAITENDVMTAAREAGLVDVKVARFSNTHTAEKLVIPRASR